MFKLPDIQNNDNIRLISVKFDNNLADIVNVWIIVNTNNEILPPKFIKLIKKKDRYVVEDKLILPINCGIEFYLNEKSFEIYRNPNILNVKHINVIRV